MRDGTFFLGGGFFGFLALGEAGLYACVCANSIIGISFRYHNKTRDEKTSYPITKYFHFEERFELFFFFFFLFLNLNHSERS